MTALFFFTISIFLFPQGMTNTVNESVNLYQLSNTMSLDTIGKLIFTETDTVTNNNVNNETNSSKSLGRTFDWFRQLSGRNKLIALFALLYGFYVIIKIRKQLHLNSISNPETR